MPSKRRRRSWANRKARMAALAQSTHCHWCGVRISTHLPVGHPQKATDDHLVPVSRWPKGQPGVNALSNFVPSCWRCNTRRGNRGVGWNRPPDNRSREW